jgi:hypothetical protein
MMFFLTAAWIILGSLAGIMVLVGVLISIPEFVWGLKYESWGDRIKEILAFIGFLLLIPLLFLPLIFLTWYETNEIDRVSLKVTYNEDLNCHTIWIPNGCKLTQNTPSVINLVSYEEEFGHIYREGTGVDLVTRKVTSGIFVYNIWTDFELIETGDSDDE